MPLICPNCGRENADDRRTCAACQAALPPPLAQLKPLGAPPPSEPQPPPADPDAGSLGTPRAPEPTSRPSWNAQGRPTVRKGRSVTVTGAIVGALIGGVGVAFFVFAWWLANREAQVPNAGWEFLAAFLSATTAGVVAGAVVGALSTAAGGGAIAGAKVAAALAAFFAIFWLAGLAVVEGSLAPIGEQAWRALVAVGVAAAFGGVIGAGAEAVMEHWT